MLTLKSPGAARSHRFIRSALRLVDARARRVAARRESRRVRFLHALRLLDTARDPFLDALTATAAAIANTPIAALSLIDADRQWFKGAHGLEVSETPLDVSFCSHTIRSRNPMIISDARLDSRFAANAAVTGDSHIHFYAGFPLVVDGFAIGALCVADDHPRRLSTRQCERLKTLAAGTVAWIGQHVARTR